MEEILHHLDGVQCERKEKHEYAAISPTPPTSELRGCAREALNAGGAIFLPLGGGVPK